MGNIVLLDELTINKIAAGEVIERPASVIKEMVENSIDAKATNITVEIRNGGISYIKITDNGKGIAQDDLEMAFERHATSKIRSAEDLNTVMSMGFRGEALASIAAISNVELISKTVEQETGYKVVVEGGKVLNKEEVACQTGTSIIVKNLFFNTPVRYKFLKKDYTETGYIEDAITRIALINPNVSIKLVNTGKTIISTSGNGNLRDVVYNIYGKDVAKGILDVNYQYEDVAISGVIGKPEIARSNRSNQLFFVNKRYVKDKILTSATEQAYKNLMETGKFAFIVLNIEIPPHKVDVNVHPAKLEVRFEEENKIFKAVYHAIEDTLCKIADVKSNIVKMDNIIIQENKDVNNNTYMNTNIKEERERKLNPFLNKRKNKNEFGYKNNIIEDLYNEKKEERYPNLKDNKNIRTINNYNDNMEQDNDYDNITFDKYKKDTISNLETVDEYKNDTVSNLETVDEYKKDAVSNFEKVDEYKKDTVSNLGNVDEYKKNIVNNFENVNNYEGDIINTSDILQELRNINNNIHKDLEKETLKDEGVNNLGRRYNYNEKENSELLDGSTYTYVGENKERIESLLRQLHPEKIKGNLSVAENIEKYNENKNTIETFSEIKEEIETANSSNKNEDNKNASDFNKKFDIIRQNLEKLDTNVFETKNIESEEIEQSDVKQNEVQQEQENIQQNEVQLEQENMQQNDLQQEQENVEQIESQQENDNLVDQKTIPFKVIPDIEKTQKVVINTDETELNEQKGEQKLQEDVENIENSNPTSTSNNNFNTMYEKLFGTPVIDEEKLKEQEEQKDEIKKINAIDIVNDNVSMFDGIEKFNKPNYKIIGIVFGAYIVVEIEKEMYIINERIAREKNIFEKIKKNYENMGNKDSQMLLLPDIINLSSKDMEVAKENMQMFEQAGFVLEEFGENTIKLSGVPTVCLKLNTRELFCQIVEVINTVARTSKQEKEEKFIEIIAQSVANREDPITTVQEVENLIDSLLQLKNPFVYVYNKQVAIKMTKYDIERKFSRK